MTITEEVEYDGYSIAEAPYLVSELWIEEVPEDVGDQQDIAAC